MKTPLVLLFLFGIVKIYGQTLSSSTINKKENVFEIGAMERIMYAKVIYEKGKKKKGKEILKRIVQEELNVKRDTAQHGIYSTIASLNLLKIDSLAGIRNLLKLVKYFENLTCTDCKNNLKRIKTQIWDLSGKDYEQPYEMIYFLEELMTFHEASRSRKKKIESNHEIDSIRFYSFGMGGGFDIMISQDSFIYQRGSWNADIVKQPKKINQIEWRKILQTLGNLSIIEIPEIEQPSGSRHFDGANYSSITVYKEKNKYVSKDFDDFRPSEELKPIVHYIRYLLRKKLDY
ncbi:MAG: hypothetical protein R2828_32740 [Saprospiraceae bacterium]